jgi:3-oxoacyl-[acyl-carrier-protein] synthase-3|tara:strand:- start:134 stop:1138 length:1005 start_codon:yes stop_codon:yes gene_type:complete
MGLIIKSIEYYLPDNIVTNGDLQKEHPDWDLEKVGERSGVHKRHIAGEDETAFDLSTKACDKLFQTNDKSKVDGIIYCTQSPDYIMPSNSFLLHDYLNLEDSVFAFDFNHACTGYIYCLAMANAFVKAGMAREILLVTADTYSKYINNKDRSTRVLFGDGAAATIVKDSNEKRGIIDVDLRSSGSGYDKFWIPAGGLRLPESDITSVETEDDRGNKRTQNDIAMDGFGVWSFINSVVPKQINRLMKKNNVKKNVIDQFIFHQASQMTLESIIKILKLDKEKVFINIYDIGNTVSASIPIALKDAIEQDKIDTGSKVILSGFGVGLSYGAILMDL